MKAIVSSSSWTCNVSADTLGAVGGSRERKEERICVCVLGDELRQEG